MVVVLDVSTTTTQVSEVITSGAVQTTGQNLTTASFTVTAATNTKKSLMTTPSFFYSDAARTRLSMTDQKDIHPMFYTKRHENKLHTSRSLVTITR